MPAALLKEGDSLTQRIGASYKTVPPGAVLQACILTSYCKLNVILGSNLNVIIHNNNK